ncbi:hypothetical protein GUA87_05200 [Sneathiella sp. P13V-1]|uniref:hypothetical protein n=1 Tax=Sneathiella sp. P13V-1 TaxID=2697366 RepID=UPI00187B840F|nr:hypothetical protein [Sneathiella sp. P13V-1]MBE7636230.1 hypothetical protein [Sneathiella sp. P13V-1]
MSRTGIKVTSSQESHSVYLSLFDEADPERRKTVSLSPDKVLQLAGKLLSASSELDIPPSEEAVKVFLQTALVSVTKDSNIVKN